VIAVVLIAGGPVPWALGQDTEFARLKAATNLSADQIQTIQRWVQQQLPDLLNAEDAREARQAAKVFADAYTGGTVVFQAAFLEQCAQAFLAPLSQPDIGPQAVLMMSMFLGRQATAPMIPTLRRMLASPHAVARFWAATGLTNLRRDVSTSPQVADVLADLQKAAASEANAVAAKQMYNAMNLRDVAGNAALLEQAYRAILSVLNARIKWHAGPERAPVEAEVAGMQALAGLMGQVDEDSRRQGIQPVAQILYHALRRFAQEDADSPARRIDALLVEQAEATLRQAVRAIGAATTMPDVLARLKAGQLDQARAELTKWIGSPQQEGLLNQTFQLPRGAGLAPLGEQPATTQPAS
jgi:hypothetical protein